MGSTCVKVVQSKPFLTNSFMNSYLIRVTITCIIDVVVLAIHRVRMIANSLFSKYYAARGQYPVEPRLWREAIALNTSVIACLSLSMRRLSS